MELHAKLVRSQLSFFKPFVAGLSLEATRKGQDKLGELMTALHRREVLGRRTGRYLQKVCALQELVAQLREAYQSQLAIQQNDLMRVFTIVTVLFLPLTLITGWFGMNFVNMPELQSEWGYPVIIAASILLVAGLLWFFRHKKWL